MTLAPHQRSDPSAVVNVLLIESDAERAATVEGVLASSNMGDFRIERVSGLTRAIEWLQNGHFDVILAGCDIDETDRATALERILWAKPDALLLPLGDAALERGSEMGPAYARAGRHAEVGDWLPHALRYVTQRKHAEVALHAAEDVLFEEKERARVTLGSIGDAVVVTDKAGNVTYLNPVGEQLTGWKCEAAVGRPLAEVFVIFDGTTRATMENPAERAIRQDRTVELESNAVLKRFDGSECGIEDSAAPIHDRHGQVTGAVIIFRHVSQSQTVTRKMAHLARHDTLTGLPNRLVLRERLALGIEQAERDGCELALVFVDVDEFKAINDSLGHLAGDNVLAGVARRLSDAVRASDTVCRIGGDEFVVLLPSLKHPSDTELVLDNLRGAFAQAVAIDGRDLVLNISLGVSRYPEDGTTINALLGRADTAMYEARGHMHSTKAC